MDFDRGQASIGFSIPITQMFRASTVWKGLVYTLLMFLGNYSLESGSYRSRQHLGLEI
jgi:hypothetical protein